MKNILKKEEVDILLTDINMPIMNGIELINLINKEHLVDEIFVMSGNFENKEILSSNKKIKGFIDKPILKVNDLIKKLI